MSDLRNTGPKAEDLAYVRFRAPDLDAMQSFLEDFGLTVQRGYSDGGVEALFSRGTGGSPYVHITERGEPGFIGLGFKMASSADLEALAALDGASNIETIQQPGGGQRVRFSDPDGNSVDGVYGIEEFQRLPPDVRPPVNSIATRVRYNNPIRLKSKRPIPVNRLGHLVLTVSDFKASEAWYQKRFGLIHSEQFYAGEKSAIIAAFFRTDRGQVPTDHHSVCLAQSANSGVNHVAFEVDDWDSVMIGHDYLSQRGHVSHWGVGKHVFGSQIFDYWEDPYGNVLEHFTDGDLFDASHVPTLEPVEALLEVQWGPNPPPKEL
ncbi:MAG: VOC family protein [Pseudomonadota bacterium]